MIATIEANQEGATKGGVARQQCCHYWVIEDPTDRASEGVCKLCGANKKFMNYLPDCLQAGEEEYEAWLSRQRDYIKGSELEDEAVPQGRRR
jgi:hypothetical protein